MFAIIYEPTNTPIGLYVNEQNAISRCKFLSDSKDFIVAKVNVDVIKKIKFKREHEKDINS